MKIELKKFFSAVEYFAKINTSNFLSLDLTEILEGKDLTVEEKKKFLADNPNKTNMELIAKLIRILANRNKR